ncbi:major facilitator superfamily domain-containing protein [Mycena floridula]|nr:major facilitator superfamily domain-containing protein [Mycena floridula]
MSVETLEEAPHSKPEIQGDEKSPEESSDLPGKDVAQAFPEGGIQAWCTVLGAFLIQFSAFGYVNIYGVYADFYVREYLTNKTSAQISLIGSTQVFFALSMGLVAGKLFDKGYFHHAVIGGSSLSVFSLFMLSLSKPGQYYQVFLSQGLGLGIGIGLTLIPTLGVLGHYFQRKRGFAMGIVISGASLGGTVHPPMLNKLFFGPVGFHNGVRASAALLTGLLFIGNLLVHTRYPPRRMAKAVSIISFAKDIPYVFTILGVFCVITGLFFPLFFLQLDAVRHGVADSLAFYTFAILNAASIFGRVIPSMFIPTFGVYNVIIPCSIGCGIMLFSLFGLTNDAATILFSILYGFFSGAFVSLCGPIYASTAKDLSEIGVRMGLGFVFNGAAVLLGSPVAGVLLTDEFLWWRPIVFSGALVFSGTFFLMIARGLVASSKSSQRV